MQLTATLHVEKDSTTERMCTVITLILWLILLFICWPLALLAIVLYPFVWLFLLPFRLIGIAVDGVLSLIRAIIFLPSRILGGNR